MDPVWRIERDDIGSDLRYVPDPASPRTHGYIEPVRPMTLQGYQRALHATGSAWRRVVRSRECCTVSIRAVGIQVRLEKALLSERPLHRVRETLRDLLDQGYSRETLLDELEQFRTVLRGSGRGDGEDVVLEAMDFLVGWSSPHMQL